MRGKSDYLAKLELNRKTGSLVHTSTFKLTSLEWAKWMTDHLGGRRFISENRDALPHSIFDRLINSDLKGMAQARAIRGVNICLDDAFATRRGKHSGIWAENDPMDELLMLAGSVGEQSDVFVKHPERITRFLAVFTPEPSPPDAIFRYDLYGRTLSALCGARSKLPYGFWLGELKHSLEHYASLCVAGAGNSSFADAIRLLPELPWSNQYVQDSMRVSLPYEFFGTYIDNPEAVAAIMEARSHLPSEARRIITEAKKRADQAKKNGVF